MIIVPAGIEKGIRKGFEVSYNNTTSIKIGAGSFEANGKLYTLSSSVTHTMTSMVAGYDQHYPYIDDNASTPPTPTIVDSTTEPAWNEAKNGWYNGDDAMIFGAIPSKPAAAEIEHFFTYYLSNRYYRVVVGSDNWMILNGISLTGNWQDPTTAASIYLPVNAKEALIKMYNTDALANVKLSWLNNEAAALNSNIFHSKSRINIYNEALFSAWGGLGTSRNIKIGGDSSNDNVMQVFVGGWGGER